MQQPIDPIFLSRQMLVQLCVHTSALWGEDSPETVDLDTQVFSWIRLAAQMIQDPTQRDNPLLSIFQQAGLSTWDPILIAEATVIITEAMERLEFRLTCDSLTY
jgi:hypothetical protein